MQWHSAAEFFAMGGYALNVWGSVAACALALAVESWLVRRRHRQLLQTLRRRPERHGGTNIFTPRDSRRGGQAA